MTDKQRLLRAAKLVAKAELYSDGSHSCIAISFSHGKSGYYHDAQASRLRQAYLDFLLVPDCSYNLVQSFNSCDDPQLARSLALLFFRESL